MTTEKILEQIELLTPSEDSQIFRLFQYSFTPCPVYYGIDPERNPAFVVTSFFPKMRHQLQRTRKLMLNTNLMCEAVIDGAITEMTIHSLVCMSTDRNERIAFIRLTEAFSKHISVNQPYIMNDLFSSLVNLFAQEGKNSEKELQGLYAELYLIYHFLKRDIDFCPYWHKCDNQNFDFSLSPLKRIEVKSTLLPERIHHFKHEQLLSELYDIVIVSLLLRKDDAGLSLLSLIEEIRSAIPHDFKTLLYIDSFTKNVPDDDLHNLRYDKTYTEEHIKFYRAERVPRFGGLQPDGVTHAEYDSDLSISEEFVEDEMFSWINIEEA